MIKFYTKGDHRDFEGAVFLNGQKVATIYTGVYPDGTIQVQIEDGSGRLMKEWEDFEETD